ncbi:hypothetical protein T492DRAFT_935513 [Pavlovales sp. CCMP2436]|nr:hypothetical protein T492DRAFT_935513 [Pavlovales sp. CCMP2436]
MSRYVPGAGTESVTEATSPGVKAVSYTTSASALLAYGTAARRGSEAAGARSTYSPMQLPSASRRVSASHSPPTRRSSTVKVAQPAPASTPPAPPSSSANCGLHHQLRPASAWLPHALPLSSPLFLPLSSVPPSTPLPLHSPRSAQACARAAGRSSSGGPAHSACSAKPPVAPAGCTPSSSVRARRGSSAEVEATSR